MACINERAALADIEFEGYNFGEGIRVVHHSSWNTDDADDLTKMVYAEFEEDGIHADSHGISFHVRFDAEGNVDEAYALSMESGNEFGERGTNKKACALNAG